MCSVIKDISNINIIIIMTTTTIITTTFSSRGMIVPFSSGLGFGVKYVAVSDMKHWTVSSGVMSCLPFPQSCHVTLTLSNSIFMHKLFRA
jgi:hypothetical protein